MEKFVTKRVIVKGWIHRLRWQGAKLLFLIVRDGSSPKKVQAVLSGDLCRTLNALHLNREATVKLYGTLAFDKRAIDGIEMQVDYWELIGPSPAEIESIINTDSNISQLLDQRHIAARGDSLSAIMRLR